MSGNCEYLASVNEPQSCIYSIYHPYIYGNLESENRSHTGGLHS